MIHVEDYRLDPPEDIVFGYCHICGGEIFIGENYLFLDFDEVVVCEDCIKDGMREADVPTV